ATLLTSVDDVLNEFQYLDGLRPGAIPAKAGAAPDAGDLQPDEEKVWQCFAGGAILSPDAISAATGLAAAEVSVALMMLELKRLIAKRADGTFEPG
ncbi:MAG TPA: DNA-protecting protein DprA, partial [Candidatus Synoicihabitans sp.]|nr:DNA-protecting protein DprA [Candidatus Synoicihabitans sp.]